MGAAFFESAVVGSRAVDDAKGELVLIEPHFKVGRAVPTRISRAPLNVKDPVGRGASNQSEYAIVRAVRAQVVLIRQNSRTQIWIRQRTGCARVGLISREQQTAIGVHIGLRIIHIVKPHWEWKGQKRRAVIAVIAHVGSPRQDRLGARSRRVLAASRSSCCSGRWALNKPED